MNVLIMGCGRMGSQLAGMLEKEGHEITVLDINPDSFRKLHRGFRGRRCVGNGVDSDDLKRAGVGQADAFVSVTPGDNRNVMSAQMAKHLFGVERVVCRIYDPIRAEIYRDLGLETINPTVVGAELLKEALENTQRHGKSEN